MAIFPTKYEQKSDWLGVEHQPVMWLSFPPKDKWFKHIHWQNRVQLKHHKPCDSWRLKWGWCLCGGVMKNTRSACYVIYYQTHLQPETSPQYYHGPIFAWCACEGENLFEMSIFFSCLFSYSVFCWPDFTNWLSDIDIGSLVIRSSCSWEEHIGRLAVDWTLCWGRLGPCRWRWDARVETHEMLGTTLGGTTLGPVNRWFFFFVSDSQPNMISKWVMVKYGDMRDATNKFFQDDVAASTPLNLGTKHPRFFLILGGSFFTRLNVGSNFEVPMFSLLKMRNQVITTGWWWMTEFLEQNCNWGKIPWIFSKFVL